MSEQPRVIRHVWHDGKQYTAHADDVTCDRCPPPTREPIRLTAEERAGLNCDCAQPYDWDDHVDSCFVPAVESILAARLAGGPTLADARTPESEDTE